VPPDQVGPASDGAAPLSATRPAGTELEQWERALIEQALRESNGNQTRAAQRLGISRDTLRYRLKKYGIQA
jgi:DNA-binding NtrC family response regulator